ncbi:hypothetical protein AC578_2842 [Pseudocercospora eumusae]|uniref:Uncharacterized protein n=1 Tax=Pseudocercospora eumusae TaxID=321146 RepID=A0A139H420_9PEZI|nr:hypothetical protein AC578_2842 [Pseudocercospora eumusae]
MAVLSSIAGLQAVCLRIVMAVRGSLLSMEHLTTSAAMLSLSTSVLSEAVCLRIMMAVCGSLLLMKHLSTSLAMLSSSSSLLTACIHLAYLPKHGDLCGVMARPGVASRSARSSEQHIDRKLEKAYQDYCAIRDVLEEMQVGEAVLGPRVEEPKRRCGRAGPWRTKTLTELEEEIGIMTRLRAAVLFGWNSRQSVIQTQQQQQLPYPPAAQPDHPALFTPPTLAGTAPIGTMENEDDAAAAASRHILQQLGHHRQYHNQQEQHGYPLGVVESQPEGAGPGVELPSVPHDFGEDPTQFQQQQQYGGIPRLSGGHPEPIDDVHQPTADPSSTGNVEQALPTPMAYQQTDMAVGDGTQQNAEDGPNMEFWDLSNSQDQEQADNFSEEELLTWAQMMGVDLSIAPNQGQEGPLEAM